MPLLQVGYNMDTLHVMSTYRYLVDTILYT